MKEQSLNSAKGKKRRSYDIDTEYINTLCGHFGEILVLNAKLFSVDKKSQLDVTFCILYFSSNSCLTYFGQSCAHHQQLTTA